MRFLEIASPTQKPANDLNNKKKKYIKNKIRDLHMQTKKKKFNVFFKISEYYIAE
jgi:hypothetical protein